MSGLGTAAIIARANLYIQTEEYIREDLPNTTVLPSLATINQMIEELDYKGNSIYLPPKYLGNSRPRGFACTIFLNLKHQLLISFSWRRQKDEELYINCHGWSRLYRQPLD